MYSLPHCLGTSAIQIILYKELAPPQSIFWACHPRCSYDRTRRFYFGKSQQTSHESRVIGYCVLADCHLRRDSRIHLGILEHHRRKFRPSTLNRSCFTHKDISQSFIFRDSALDITARQVRAKGAVAAQSPSTSSQRTYVNEFMTERNSSVRSGRTTLLPTHSSVKSGRNDRGTRNPRLPLTISQPINYYRVERPNDAHVHHPAYNEKF